MFLKLNMILSIIPVPRHWSKGLDIQSLYHGYAISGLKSRANRTEQHVSLRVHIGNLFGFKVDVFFDRDTHGDTSATSSIVNA
jgi:hypothetical protein